MPQILLEKLQQGIELEMVRVEGGVFIMGVDDYWDYPHEEVQVNPFYLSKYPITQAQWQAVMGSNPSYFHGADRPVEKVSWHDTQQFIKQLNKQAGEGYRLPTQAEWEYAARGGNKSKGYIYAGSNDLNDVGWYRENSHRETKDVGLKFPNELGLYDMSGNVWEWCQDKKGSERVLRGGSWYYYPQYCRVAYRGGNRPEHRGSNVGFRLAFSLQSAG